MPDARTPDEIRRSTDKAKDYFSKVSGFEPPASANPQPAPEPAPEEAAPAWAKPEAPLSDAEKAWKRLMGK